MSLLKGSFLYYVIIGGNLPNDYASYFSYGENRKIDYKGEGGGLNMAKI